jgi:hypothetical protein
MKRIPAVPLAISTALPRIAVGEEKRLPMAQLQCVREQWRDEVYPMLDLMEIERARRVGNVRSFAAGESASSGGMAETACR